MFNRIACSLRNNPSKVQPYQAGLDNKDEKKYRQDNGGVGRTKTRSRELRWKPRTHASSFSWNPDSEMKSDKPRLFESLELDCHEQNEKQLLLPEFNLQKHQDAAYTYGTLVWAKFSKTWWPAIVVDGFLAKVDPPKNGNLWVMWFGDHKVSEVARSSIDLFTNNFIQRSEGKHSSIFETAITDALKICSDRAKLELLTYESIKTWRRSEAGFITIARQKPKMFDPDQDSPYPPMVLRALWRIADMHSSAPLSDSDTEPESTPEEKINSTDNKEEVLNIKPVDRSVMQGDFCISCAKSEQVIVSEHPLFEGSICMKCKDSIMETFFALDEDGHYLFCGICGQGGLLLLCEMPDCGRSYCMPCVRKYIDHTSIKKLKSVSPWACFLCSPYHMETHGLLKPQQDWQERVLMFFNPRVKESSSLECLLSLDNRAKEKIRVLSLFDGIGTVKYVLDQLGLDVEVYYASEIDPAAELVTMFNHGFSVSQLGDIFKVERTTLQEICPIDLLVGSPPCDDLDISNKDYEGFNGNGTFMFKFLLILKDLEIISNGRPVYWLLETTANIKAEYLHVLNNFFENPPALWDSKYFTAYLQPRYYWGNLPNMYSAFEYYKKLQVFMGTVDYSLDDYLVPNLNRKAAVSKLRSVAIETKSESTRQSSTESWNEKMVNYCLPVLMDGRTSEIWVNEVEKVLGFPEHYTDVSKMKISQRQKLLKQASSVHILKHLLKPLTNIYATK